jgi:hypothetical protein
LIICTLLLTRGIIIIVTRNKENYEETMMENDFKNNGWHFAVYAFLYLIILSLVPTIAQILMLKFILVNRDDFSIGSEFSNDSFWDSANSNLMNVTSQTSAIREFNAN